MDKQNLIIFKLNSFYNIMKELEENLNFKIFKATNEKILNTTKGNLKKTTFDVSQFWGIK